MAYNIQVLLKKKKQERKTGKTCNFIIAVRFNSNNVGV